MKLLQEKATKLMELAKLARCADHIDVKMFLGPERMDTLTLLKGVSVVNEMVDNIVAGLMEAGLVNSFEEAEIKYPEVAMAMGALCNAENIVERLEADIIVKYNKESRNSYYSAEENYEIALMANEAIKHFLGIDVIAKYEANQAIWF